MQQQGAMRAHRKVLAVLAMATGACGSTPAARSPAQASTPAVHDAHELVILATSCWMGGLWSDALGESGDARYAGIERRCNALLKEVDVPQTNRVPTSQPEAAYYPMRAVEPAVVDAIAGRVDALAKSDPAQAPHAQDNVALLRAVAAAARETIHARRAADSVKEDVREAPAAAATSSDKRQAAEPLRAGDALGALFRADVGPYTDEAHAIALLSALDRMEIARGLPKHLKIETVRVAFREVFGVSAPELPDDASAPIHSGTWLTYLTDVAAAAGHPVPGDAHDPQNREPLAWTGVLQGFADRLQGLPAHGAVALATVEQGISARLDREYKDGRQAYEAHKPADR
jgi:hypothetical protein